MWTKRITLITVILALVVVLFSQEKASAPSKDFSHARLSINCNPPHNHQREGQLGRTPSLSRGFLVWQCVGIPH